MLLYSLIMLPVSLLFAAFSIAIYNGKTNLIHDYHQKRVTDRAGYGKAFGKALALVALGPLRHHHHSGVRRVARLFLPPLLTTVSGKTWLYCLFNKGMAVGERELMGNNVWRV